MLRYQFFKQGECLTFLNPASPSYEREAKQLIGQGFVALGTPLEASDPTAALQQVRRAWSGEVQHHTVMHPHALLLAAA
ncbi:hypothetical protein [Aeromonas simiae]|uniref:Uncharacterized protein n=1 Tax=Aeromonas simiae TaxID=218936 RepID=A0A5J6WU19_9GAMM|nr:hypothetical protein [Aeromonas simiae]MDO2947705.1 hypothetical protein [Aeromonas simiae]MDO2952325.1 hypothetical protein [Aeromonas simiae]MDO2954920.1 hypothetical protein [Aeromonas simiae]QFI54629.1 hypothetical protein FE240_07910 [Aeromonas simiae]